LINTSEITKLSNQSGANTGDQDISGLATTTALSLKVDKAAGERLINASEITKLSNQLGTNTGDQDLSGFATTTALGLKENAITATTTADYYRGDKTFRTLDKAAVGLPNIDNTSDANKPISTATQTALNLKANIASPTFTGTVSGIDKTMVGLGNINNTSDANKPVSTATQTALDLKIDKALVDGKILIGNGSNVATAVTPFGDVIIDNLGETTIGDTKVTYPKIQNVSAANRVLGRASSGSGPIEEITTTGTGNVVRSTSPTLITPSLGTPAFLVGQILQELLMD
jgi:hypothetical protein